MFSAVCAVAIVLAVQNPAASRTPQPEPWPDDRPVTQLFPNFWHDLKAVASPRSAYIAAAGTAVTLALAPLDDDARDAAETAQPTSYAKIGNVIGDGWFQGSAAVATYAIGRAIGDPETTHIGSDLIRGQLLNAVITGALKVTTNRTRPNGGDFSFPSGHASATFTSASVLESHYGWKVGVPAYAISGFVAWCRVRSQDHWVSDTAAGATLGIIVGHTVTAGHRQRDWQVIPAKTAGGFAVYVTRTK